jgi:hypothetical protein
MGQLLTEAGYTVRSGDTGDQTDKIIVQLGKIDAHAVVGDATETPFPLLQTALCCWLVGSSMNELPVALRFAQDGVGKDIAYEQRDSGTHC